MWDSQSAAPFGGTRSRVTSTRACPGATLLHRSRRTTGVSWTCTRRPRGSASASDVCEVVRREKQAWQGRREGACQERTCPTENAARRSFFARRTLPTLLVEALVPPLGLWVDEGVTCGDLLGTHDLEAVALPLGEQELALWTSGLVPSEGAEDRLDLVVVQIVGQRLLVVDVAHLFHRSLQNLSGCERIGRVLGGNAPEHLPVLLNELGIHRSVEILIPADCEEDAFCVSRPDCLGVLRAEGRRRRLEESTRTESGLDERSYKSDAVLENRSLGDHVRVP